MLLGLSWGFSGWTCLRDVSHRTPLEKDGQDKAYLTPLPVGVGTRLGWHQMLDALVCLQVTLGDLVLGWVQGPWSGDCKREMCTGF